MTSGFRTVSPSAISRGRWPDAPAAYPMNAALTINETRSLAHAGVAADLGLLLQLGAIADAAEAVSMYTEAAFDFAVDGEVPALGIAVGRVAAYADLMRKLLAELIGQKGNFA